MLNVTNISIQHIHVPINFYKKLHFYCINQNKIPKASMFQFFFVLYNIWYKDLFIIIICTRTLLWWYVKFSEYIQTIAQKTNQESFKLLLIIPGSIYYICFYTYSTSYNTFEGLEIQGLTLHFLFVCFTSRSGCWN